MAELVPMLALSPTMTEGTIAAWKIEEGGSVKNGAVLAEVETDKAVMDYEASSNGTLLKILVPPGSTVQVGQPIAIIGQKGEDFSKLLGSLPGKTNPAAPPAKLELPPVSATLAPVPPKADASAPVPPGSASPGPVPPVIPVSNPGTNPVADRGFAKESEAPEGPVPIFPPGFPPSSPLARQIAKASGIDIRGLRGTGPHGRVVKRDVEALLSQKNAVGAPYGAWEQGKLSQGASPQVKSQTGTVRLEDRSVPLSRFKAVSARRLSESMREAPHFYLRSAIDMDRLLAFRNLINQGRSEDSKISLNALFIKLSAMAIGKNPHINVSWGESALVYHSSVDIALAVALPEGLVAPVVRDCYHRGLEDIEGDLRRLIAKARSGTLTPQDYEGATFTISNLGAWGVEEFTAIINPPGSAILAVGATVKEPVVRSRPNGTDRVVIRSMVRVTLSCDHRTIDGAQGAQFMGDVKKYFEEPAWGLL